MDVDIDDLYEKHFAWKRNLEGKDHVIHMLDKQVKVAEQEKDSLKKCIENLYQGMTAINENLIELRDDMEKYKNYEPELKILLEDNKRLTEQIEDVGKRCEEQMFDMTCEITVLTNDYEEKIKRVELDITLQKNEELATIQGKVIESEKKIQELEKSIKTHKSERNKFFHLKNEYEKQMLKTKEQELAIKQSVKVSLIKEEIFRKKYENLEKIEAEKNKEIKLLHEQIEELKRHNKRLIETKHSSLHNYNSTMLTKSIEKTSTCKLGSFPLSKHQSQINSSTPHSLATQHPKPSTNVKKAVSTDTELFVKPQETASAEKGIADNLKPAVSNLSTVSEKSTNEQGTAKSEKQVKRRKLFNQETNFLSN